MSLRKIHISNKKSRNTLVNFKGFPAKATTKKVDADTNKIFNKKIIKGTAANSFESLAKEQEGDLDKLAEELINGDPEIDLEITGKFLGQSPKVYVNEDLKVVYKVTKTEKIYSPQGELKEERPLRHLAANVISDDPLKWSDKYFPIEEIYNKFVFVRTYQLFHDSGLTYDYLYEMAKELEEKKSFLLLGSGKKGIGPAIFQEGGTPYRVFLEGRTQGDQYMILIHLSNLEFKNIINE